MREELLKAFEPALQKVGHTDKLNDVIKQYALTPPPTMGSGYSSPQIQRINEVMVRNLQQLHTEAQRKDKIKKEENIWAARYQGVLTLNDNCTTDCDTSLGALYVADESTQKYHGSNLTSVKQRVDINSTVKANDNTAKHVSGGKNKRRFWR